ncbi:MAG: hypothetical protein ACLFO5_08095 [Opitutales bacterium]
MRGLDKMQPEHPVAINPEALLEDAKRLWSEGEYDAILKRTENDRSALAKVIHCLGAYHYFKSRANTHDMALERDFNNSATADSVI